MAYSLHLEIFGLPKTTNSIGRTHWAVKAKEAKDWRYKVSLLTVGKRPENPLKKARIVYTRFSAVSPDSDGLVSSFKHIQDGLIDGLVIENDKMQNIGMPTYRWEKASRGEGKITIEVYEI